VDLPRRRFFLPTGISEAYADDPRGADLAEGRGEAAGDFAEFLASGGQLVGAGRDVVGVCLIAGAAGFVGFREGYEEGEEGGGDFGGGWEVHFGLGLGVGWLGWESLIGLGSGVVLLMLLLLMQ
jgi:hypothetical protein